MNTVRTFNAAGKMVYEANFNTPEAAYNEYIENRRILKERLPRGEKIILTRWEGNSIMTIEEVVGTH